MESEANMIVFYVASGLVIGAFARICVGLSFRRWALYGLIIAPVAAIHFIVRCVCDSSGDAKPKIGAALLVLVVCAAGYMTLRPVCPLS